MENLRCRDAVDYKLIQSWSARGCETNVNSLQPKTEHAGMRPLSSGFALTSELEYATRQHA
jgi:hypothetical protein